MAWLLNKTERVITVEGHMLVPTIHKDVHDAVMDNSRIKELIASGELEITGAPPPIVENTPVVSNESETDKVSDSDQAADRLERRVAKARDDLKNKPILE